MDLLVAALVWAGVVIISMLLTSFLAVRWGRDPFGWALLSAVLGPIALVALFGTRQSDVERQLPYRRPSGGARTIVAGVDGSPASLRVAEHVAALHPVDTEVVVLAVLPHEAQPAPGVRNAAHEEQVARMTGEAMRVLREAGVAARVEVGYGAPGEELLRCADEEGATLIVVGRRGAGLSKALLGSVSDHVVKHARHPVVVVS